MSLLTMVQDATDRLLNIPRPAVVAGNEDDSVRQMLSLLNEEGADLATRWAWQALTRTVTFPATDSGESVFTDQGALTTRCPGLLYIVDDTIWLAGQAFKPVGPLSPQERSAMQAHGLGNAAWGYFIEGGHLYLTRPTSANQQITLRYQSANWALDAAGNPKARLDTDTDTAALDERLLTLGLVWRWLERNGLPYEQEYMNHTAAVNRALSRDGTRGVIDAAGGARPMNGVMVVEA